MTLEQTLPYQAAPPKASPLRFWTAASAALLGVQLLPTVAVAALWLLSAIAPRGRGGRATVASVGSTIAIPLASWALLALIRGLLACRHGACVAAFVMAGVGAAVVAVAIGSWLWWGITLDSFLRIAPNLLLLIGGVVALAVLAARLMRQAAQTVRDTPLRLTIEYYLEDTCLAGGLMAFTCLVALFIVPGFREIFRDFRTNLPALTEWLLIVSDGIASSPASLLILVAGSGLLPVPMLLWRLARPPVVDPRRRPRILLPWIILFFVELAILAIALFLPLIKLIQAVNGEGPGGP